MVNHGDDPLAARTLSSFISSSFQSNNQKIYIDLSNIIVHATQIGAEKNHNFYSKDSSFIEKSSIELWTSDHLQKSIHTN